MGGCGSLYVYVVTTPASWLQAHTRTSTWWRQPIGSSPPPRKHTIPYLGGSPASGCKVASHPGETVPHDLCTGGVVGMRVPASPVKVYHCALESDACPAIGPLCASHRCEYM